MRPRFATTPVLVLLVLGLTLLVTPGCDAVNDAVNEAIPAVDVPLGSAGDNIPVAPGAAARTTSVDGEEDLPSGFDVTDIILEEEHVSYQPLLSKTSRAASGTVFAAIIIDQVPAVSTTITITDDEVTDISPDEISVGSYDADALATAVAELSVKQRTALLRNDYRELSAAAIRDIVAEALTSDSFELSVLVYTDGDLAGTLDIEQMTIDIEV